MEKSADLKIAHFDCDCFFAAVEKRDRIDLHDKPVAVGGDGPRSVVAAACYVARIYGVRSAMPMMKAKEICPNLVIVPHDFSKYKQAQQQIKEILHHTGLPLKYDMLDEGYLDISHYTEDKMMLCADLQKKIRKNLNLTISFGLGPNHTMAKIICNIEKPSGLTSMTTEEMKQWMKDKSVNLLPGVGPSTQARLRKIGITRISQLQTADELNLVQHFGKFGTSLKAMSLAKGKSPQITKSHKSISLENTFARNVVNIAQLESAIHEFSHSLARKLNGQACIKIFLKLRNDKFETINRNITLIEPIWQAEKIAEAGLYLLKNITHGKHHYHAKGSDIKPKTQLKNAYRLIGLGLSGFVNHRGSFSLFDESAN